MARCLQWRPTSHPVLSQALLGLFVIFQYLSVKFLANMLTQEPQLGLILGWIIFFFLVFIQSIYEQDQGIFSSAPHIEYLWGGTKAEI